MPPSKYMGLPARAWGETDFLLTRALDLHEDMLCPGGCGHYADEAHSGQHAGGYEVDDTTVCHACAAREQWQHDHSGENRPEMGTLTYVKRLERAPRRRGVSRPH